MTILTLEQMTQAILKTLDEVVTAEFAENEREKAKARILDAFSQTMFQGPIEKDEK